MAELAKNVEPTYEKSQILTSSRYQDRRDLLGAMLEDTGRYTLKQIDTAIDKYMKGKVK
ncbi:hypothetical protein MUB23_04030 [Cuneatibacter sp. NSJ-177]|uniref:hypothetical protein n=1 Tax=Cuneatibacter sp. NSJ-177 TaxID=2931401 RepID=UPI001FD4A102|nr:hypothetical protein [Cuneatibacter sp. NSJ-177]MCJ7834563.1 hypothetical protein [Cuneatibacter sp. NSJ-177]